MTRSGEEYIRALQDTRTVFLAGQRVEDVTAHPAFAETVKSVARLYDIANEPTNQQLMTFPSLRDGGFVNNAYLIPHGSNDLVARRKTHKCWADASYGLLGRSPDHVASFFAGFAGAPGFFELGGRQFADNVLRFYNKASSDDLYLAYTVIHPTVDRSQPAHKQPEANLYASVFKELDEGAIIRGAMMIGTGAVIADYIFVSVITPLITGDEDYALSFVVPSNTPGLKIYPRRPYALGQSSVFDYPLSTRFDETDSLIVLDDVLIPWENIFIYRNIELTFTQWTHTSAHILGNTQALIRSSTKLQFLIGLVKRICDRNGTVTRPEVQAQLGDLATKAALVEAMILAAESTATEDQYGVMRPNPAIMHANQVLQATIYPEVVDLVRNMMGGSLIQLPSSSTDFANPDIAVDLNRYVRWPSGDATERTKLLKLLWDLISSEFAGRHMQYELFYAGPPSVVKGREFRAYDWAGAERLVDHCLDSFELFT
ncbi:MAG: hypothetical protein BZY82_00370 [SAR202 cluster bacterium Io17-Chloro-G3]|nr:MAG: hypothetical protein BZY82_00370 [SAR202 cluster bacterium Io17-Chloro-G3]